MSRRVRKPYHVPAALEDDDDDDDERNDRGMRKSKKTFTDSFDEKDDDRNNGSTRKTRNAYTDSAVFGDCSDRDSRESRKPYAQVLKENADEKTDNVMRKVKKTQTDSAVFDDKDDERSDRDVRKTRKPQVASSKVDDDDDDDDDDDEGKDRSLRTLRDRIGQKTQRHPASQDHKYDRYSDHEEEEVGRIRRAYSEEYEEDDEEEEYEPNKIEEEFKYKEMLDQSTSELKEMIQELDKRYDLIENEGNEWKTRYETQTEMNQQLEKQCLVQQEKIEDLKRNLKDAGKSPRDNRVFDDLADASPQMVKALEKERNSLYNQLRDLEWRLDQESKAYHKANDERKQYVLEINATKGTLGDLRTKQRQLMLTAPESPPRITPRVTGDSPRTYRDGGGNIREDQRILDAKYGPIKRTAGIKVLPSLDSM
ncbi:probable serine/threonine-protein kinase kinX [Physella acuta]|uniref:probable serine/threonine-protein kinase kinX n=1 Tax=Physella acuta TaxID=109671 RepID=UPI0027DDDA27|nr:probable serine/threonine-protein kinase kinX [Physella acuta]